MSDVHQNFAFNLPAEYPPPTMIMKKKKNTIASHPRLGSSKIEDRTATTIEATTRTAKPVADTSGNRKRISQLLLHVNSLIIVFTSALISKLTNAWGVFLLTFGITCGLGISLLIWVDVGAEPKEALA